jgi:hypothetical protein
MRDVFVNTFKFTANATMAMLFVALTSCSGEKIGDHHPAQAKSLMTEIDSVMSLGKTVVTFSGSATTADEKNISGEGNLTYTCLPKVYVETLGLPTDVKPAANGTYTSSDTNTFHRSFEWNGNGVNGSSTGEWKQTVILNEINDSTELVEAQFEESWSVWTNLLPSEGNYTSSKSGKELVRVQYLRVVKQTPAPEVTYRRSFELDFSSISKGKVFAQMRVDKVQGNEVLETASHFGVIASWGKYNPQVTSINVLSTEFRNKDITGVNAFSAEKDNDKNGLGDDGKYTRRCVRHTNETFSDVFTSTPDADGNTDRPVRSNLDVWVYTYTCVLSDGHTETFNIDFEIKSVKNEVDPTTNTYERIIEVKVNGEVVDTMTGRVQLIVD